MTVAKPELPLYRLYVLRVGYAVLGVLQGLRTWPAILHHTQPWDFWHGVGMSFLGALTLLALLGARYPVRMMPLLIFEFTWKLIWALAVWLAASLPAIAGARPYESKAKTRFQSRLTLTITHPLVVA
jgi:hypothetical protein